MGNINYNNFMCENYYCQSVSFQPEWLSESSWKVSYNETAIKPYKIEKGVLKIRDIQPNNILLSKKILINFNEIRNIIIPTNFKYDLTKEKKVDLYYIFSDFEFTIDDIKRVNETDMFNHLFYIKLELSKNKIYIYRSFEKSVVKHNIKSKKINSFTIELENNHDILLTSERLLNYYEEKFINSFQFKENTDYYLNLYIEMKESMSNNEYIELNFE